MSRKMKSIPSGEERLKNILSCSARLPARCLFPAHTLQNPRGVIVVFHTCVSGCRMSPGSESYSLASSLALGRSPHNRSSPSNLSCSSDASGSSAHWRQKSMPEQ